MFWRISVRLIQGISAMDPATTTANLGAAALVVLVPFSTQGISDLGSAPYALSTVLYASNIALASLARLICSRWPAAVASSARRRPRGSTPPG